MAHHGQDPRMAGEFLRIFGKQDDEDAVKRIKELVSEQFEAPPALGDTGQYPQGALNADDEGEIRFGIARDGNKVVFNFGKPVAWMGCDADQAIDLARLLIKHAGEIKGVPMTLRIGRDE